MRSLIPPNALEAWVQFALQARAGTDALAASVRAAFSLRPGAVLVPLDSRSAYDSMSRVAFLSKLRGVAPELLPFVRLFLRPTLQLLRVGRYRDMPGRSARQGLRTE